MSTDFDIAIAGSGFAGSLTAMIARRLGRSVIMLERGTHPRFAIGESSSPLANLLIEEIATRYDLPRLLPLASWGTWQRAYPEVGCGLKRGFTFFHHTEGCSYRTVAARSNQLLVAASPSDQVSDTHWFRADFDHFLQREAVSLGAEYVDRVRLASACRAGDSWQIAGEREGGPFRVSARFLVDATGPRGFISRALGVAESAFSGYPPTRALYSHFLNVKRCDTMPDFAADAEPPYTMDDAAVHQVFDGGWMWQLRFNNGITSAGIAVVEGLAERLKLDEGVPAWERFLPLYPSLRDQFEGAEAAQPFVYASRLSYRASAAAGDGWAMLPSAAAFIDPLFSTGFPLTLLGISRLADLLDSSWGSRRLADGLCEYSRSTLEEADWVARYVAACYRSMRWPERFNALSMFYFGAASYAEIARRIGRSDLVQRFLAADRTDFRAGFERCAAAIEDESLTDEAFARMVADAIEPLNIAGLADPTKRNWYPVDLRDVVRGAGKVGLTPNAMAAIVATAPWARTE